MASQAASESVVASSVPSASLTITLEELKEMALQGRVNAILGYLLYNPSAARGAKKWVVRPVNELGDVPASVKRCDARITPTQRQKLHSVHDMVADESMRCFFVARIDSTMTLDEAMDLADYTIVADYDAYRQDKKCRPLVAFKWALKTYEADAMYRGFDYPRKGAGYRCLAESPWPESQCLLTRQQQRLAADSPAPASQPMTSTQANEPTPSTSTAARCQLFHVERAVNADETSGEGFSAPLSPSILAKGGGKSTRASPRLKGKGKKGTQAERASDPAEPADPHDSGAGAGAAAGGSGGGSGGGGGSGRKEPDEAGVVTVEEEGDPEDDPDDDPDDDPGDDDDDDDDDDAVPASQEKSKSTPRGKKRKLPSQSQTQYTPTKRAKYESAKIDRSFKCQPDCKCINKTQHELFRELSGAGPENHMEQIQTGQSIAALQCKMDALARVVKDLVKQNRTLMKKMDENISFSKVSAERKTIGDKHHNDRLLLGIPYEKMSYLQAVEGNKDQEDALAAVIESVTTSERHAMRDISQAMFTPYLRDRTYATCPKGHYTKTGVYLLGIKYAVLPDFFYQLVKVHLMKEFKLGETQARGKMNNFYNMRRKIAKIEDEQIFLQAKNRTSAFYEMVWCNTKANLNVIDEEAPLEGTPDEQKAFLYRWREKVGEAFQELSMQDRNGYVALAEFNA